MRMIPVRPPATATGTELQVFDLLKAIELDAEATAFVALGLSEHEYKKWGEIDFIVLYEGGLLVIEVKGGLVSCDSRGIWRYESRGHKPVERPESPIAQASSAYFSLRNNHLIPAIGHKVVRKAPSGFCALLAKTPSQLARGLIGGPEMHPSLVGTQEDVRSPAALERFLQRVLDYWRADGIGDSTWAPDEVAAIGRALRPCFDRIPPLSLTAARVRQEQLALTEEQYAVLDFADRAPRVLCTAGAGCGKTLLAMECLRRESQHDPVLVTGTHPLAAHLRASAPEQASRILSFQEVTQSHAAREFGCLIVDEGQQLTNRTAFQKLSALLAGGLEDGRWRWFTDPNNQVLSTTSFDPECQRFLETRSFPGTLSKNCRNTPQIVSAVELLTGADVGLRHMAGRGPEVCFANGPAPGARLASAASIVRSWLADPEIRPDDIVMVSPDSSGRRAAVEIARLAGVPARAWTPGWGQQTSGPAAIGVATLDEFRGLEAPFIVLCDLEAGTRELARWVYLGLTRANFAVLVVAEPAAVAGLAEAAGRARRQPRGPAHDQ